MNKPQKGENVNKKIKAKEEMRGEMRVQAQPGDERMCFEIQG